MTLTFVGVKSQVHGAQELGFPLPGGKTGCLRRTCAHFNPGLAARGQNPHAGPHSLPLGV